MHRRNARAARQLARFPLSRAQLHLARTNVAVSQFVGRVVGAPRTQVVYNCADTSVFKPGAPTGERTRLLFLGRFVGEKGVETLLRAVGRARELGHELLLISSEADLSRRSTAAWPASFRFPGNCNSSVRSVANRSPSPSARASRSSCHPPGTKHLESSLPRPSPAGALAVVSDRGGLPEVVDGMDTVVPLVIVRCLDRGARACSSGRKLA